MAKSSGVPAAAVSTAAVSPEGQLETPGATRGADLGGIQAIRKLEERPRRGRVVPEMRRHGVWRPCDWIFALLLLLAPPLLAQPTVDPRIEVEVDELIGQMTLAEKIGQLNLYSAKYDGTDRLWPDDEVGRARYQRLMSDGVGSMINVLGAVATRSAQELAVKNSRLGIPLLFGYDVIHGFKTIFPVPLGETASWDLEAIELSARIAATEAAAAGVHWTLAPMVDIARDSRWGRIMEGAGEDPYLGARVAAARVRGFQGTDLRALDTVAACAKHFAGGGLAEAGRDYNIADISEQTLHNVVLPPFKAALDAGVATFMSSFNEIGGTPATASELLQRTILKGEWGFQGFVVSDWSSIGELVPHGVAAGARDAARLAMVAGSDIDMESGVYALHLASLIESGEVDARLIDDAVRRVLRVKFRLGLFDDPYRYSDPEREQRVVLSDAHLAAARDVARKSIVLLKNNRASRQRRAGGPLLPLSKTEGTIAVIGPLAADKDTPLGGWRALGKTDSAVSLLEGIQAAVGPEVTIRHAQGAPLGVGERNVAAEIEFNDDDRSGFAEAKEAARGADVVILALGEEAFQTGEGRSQVDVGLKGVQNELLREVLAVNPNVVVVLMNGRPLAIGHVAESVPTVLEAWHLGSQAGHAIADVLFGDYNPSGKLPVSFPRHVGQEPLYYNHKNTGRPGPSDSVFWSHYTDAPNTPLYPFGHGLSYTTFNYSKVTLSTPTMILRSPPSGVTLRSPPSGVTLRSPPSGAANGQQRVSVTVTNTGDRPGAEVVQLYIRDLVGSTTRPVKELKGFERIELSPGESRTVTFTLDASDLAFYTARGVWEAEPGEFVVSVGTNSVDVQSARFTLQWDS